MSISTFSHRVAPLESTGGSFPAACREFVIPAEAGIQQGPTGFRVKHGMTGENSRRYPAACCGVVHSYRGTIRQIVNAAGNQQPSDTLSQ